MSGAATANIEVFRTRGHSVSRIEALSDAVFALAMTLLIVSVGATGSFEDLMKVVWGFPAFAICFAVLIWLWHAHYAFYRRFALQDGTTMLLNSVLLFVVLFYVYPLKFVFGGFITGMMGRSAGPGVPSMTAHQVGEALVLYGIGFAAVWGIFALMYAHAYRSAASLGLNPMERLLTRAHIGVYTSRVLLAMISISVALFGPDRWVGMAGWVYFAMSITETAHGMSVGRRARLLVQRLGPEAVTRSSGPPSGTAHPPPG